MPRSAVNTKKDYEFTTDRWLVTVLNTGSPFAGHAMIVVEGMESKIPNFFEQQLFVGQYDINALLEVDESSTVNINRKGKITTVRCFETNQYTREYKQYTSRSEYVTSVQAKAMIASIKEDRDVCESAQRGECEFPNFQLVGSNHFLSELDMGDNCASWCLKKLAVAGIGDGSGLSKPEVVARGWEGLCVIL